MKQKDNRKVVCITSLLLCFAVLFSYVNIRSFADSSASAPEDTTDVLTKDNMGKVLERHQL